MARFVRRQIDFIKKAKRGFFGLRPDTDKRNEIENVRKRHLIEINAGEKIVSHRSAPPRNDWMENN